MKLAEPRCPECGEHACTIEETMLVNYEIGLFDDTPEGEFEYTGEYEDFADTAQPHIVEGTVKVYCPEGHDWRTALLELGDHSA